MLEFSNSIRRAIGGFFPLQNSFLLLFALAFAAISSIALKSIGVDADYSFKSYFALMGLLIPTFFLVLAVLWFFHMLIWIKPERPLNYAKASLAFIFSKEMLFRGVPVFIYLFLVMSAYSGLKVHIEDFSEYSWDSTLADIDKALFFGRDPWTIVHNAFPGVVWAKIFNVFYHLWFFVMFGLWFWVAGMPSNDQSRVAYLFAYAFCWAVGGILIAVTFASVGPCYHERLLGDPRFSKLMETLQGYDLMAVAVQDQLWDIFVTQSNGVGARLSAFPSMHCASATLFTLFGFSRNRPLGWALAIFATFIYIGSVYLGWHYAVDGIAGIVVGIASWLFGLFIADRMTTRSRSRQIDTGTAGVTG
ncbi:phosphatase PAP2 family protein [Mesorhizobium sp. SP-1A]|uniref:phosphatase PAP2 family protein n=1 Tax=Mesorhizobium sp. SP-1A TaxID=3077840 RepID=UPI0028F746C3|nr:phosphatase PAP2 family protein [Mesorhizobium sp. SP-1A]